MRSKAYRINQVALGILAILLALVGGMAWQEFHAVAVARDSVGRTYASMDAIQDLSLGLREADSAQHRFAATGDPGALASYKVSRERLENLLQELQSSVGADAKPLPLVAAISSVISEWNKTVDAIIPAPVEEATHGDAVRPVSSMLSAMRSREEEALSWRLGVQESTAAALRWLVMGGALIAMAALLWSSRMLDHALKRSEASEAEQRAQALRLRVILDSLEQGVGVFSSDGTLTESNARLGALVEPEKITGFLQGDMAIPSDLDMRRTSMVDGGFVLTVTDMSERTHAEESERVLGRMQAVAHLTSGIAHDFNNILTIMLGNLEMIGNKMGQTDPLRPRILRVEEAARRGALLTSQLRAFARMQALSPRSLHLGDELDAMLPALQAVLGPNHQIRFEEDAGTWLAMADPAQLENALVCMVANAAEAMPNGGEVQIHLGNAVLDIDSSASRAGALAGEYAVIYVSDTGCGMEPEVAARAFEPFFTTKPSGQSRGMGLAMVFGFAKQSGGHVELSSSPGVGTVVRLLLPRGARVEPALPPPVAPAEAVARILMAEDEVSLREVAADMLSDMGYAVVQAGSGEEALSVFEGTPDLFDMLLTDVVMPGMDGRELASRISELRPGMPVLYMSGYPRDAIVHDGRLDGDVRLLNKPFRGFELAAMVKETLRESGKAA